MNYKTIIDISINLYEKKCNYYNCLNLLLLAIYDLISFSYLLNIFTPCIY